MIQVSKHADPEILAGVHLHYRVAERGGRKTNPWKINAEISFDTRLACVWLVRPDPCPVKERCDGTEGDILKVWLSSKHCLSPTPIMTAPRARYSGPSRKLVVGIDIGTTFSGAAYTLLDPGKVPEIQSVTKQVFLLIPDKATNGDEHGTGI